MRICGRVTYRYGDATPRMGQEWMRVYPEEFNYFRRSRDTRSEADREKQERLHREEWPRESVCRVSQRLIGKMRPLHVVS